MVLAKIVSALRYFNQITSSDDYTELRLKDGEKSLPNQCSHFMQCCEVVAEEGLGVNHHCAILSCVLFGEPWTAPHHHLSRQWGSSRLKPPETEHVT